MELTYRENDQTVDVSRNTPLPILVAHSTPTGEVLVTSVDDPLPIFMSNTLDPANDRVGISGSDDGGVTMRLLKATAAGELAVQIAAASIVLGSDNQAVYRPAAFKTTTVLGASGVFTSASVDGANFRRITGLATSNVAGTLNIEQSEDATAWHVVHTEALAAGAVGKYDVLLYERYVRGRFVNGATAQTSFLFTGRLSAL